jgi:cbb3-type cytochrome oxidase subunit 3
MLLLLKNWKLVLWFLLVLAGVGVVAYMHHLQNSVDRANQRADEAESQLKQTRLALAAAQGEVKALQKAQQLRVRLDEQIQKEAHERSIRTRAILAKPENKAVADIVLPADMLDGLRQ